jgi:hypothetical protein
MRRYLPSAIFAEPANDHRRLRNHRLFQPR